MSSSSSRDKSKQYVEERVIGSGTFCQAVLVLEKKSGKEYVMKKVDISQMNKKEKKSAELEVSILRLLKHPFVTSYKDCFETKRHLCIVMEYCENGELHGIINKFVNSPPFEEKLVLRWFVQLCLALQFVHDKNILHRDLKTQNVFVTNVNKKTNNLEKSILKMGDFGISKVLGSDTEMAKTIIGTPYYLSPEICEDKPYNKKSDVWALGCVLYEIVTRQHAFDGKNLPALIMKIMRGKYPPVSNFYSTKLRELIALMLKIDPNQRPSINQILSLRFLRETKESLMMEAGLIPPPVPQPITSVSMPSLPSTKSDLIEEKKVEISEKKESPRRKSTDSPKKIEPQPVISQSQSPRKKVEEEKVEPVVKKEEITEDHEEEGECTEYAEEEGEMENDEESSPKEENFVKNDFVSIETNFIKENEKEEEGIGKIKLEGNADWEQEKKNEIEKMRANLFPTRDLSLNNDQREHLREKQKEREKIRTDLRKEQLKRKLSGISNSNSSNSVSSDVSPVSPVIVGSQSKKNVGKIIIIDEKKKERKEFLKEASRKKKLEKEETKRKMIEHAKRIKGVKPKLVLNKEKPDGVSRSVDSVIFVGPTSPRKSVPYSPVKGEITKPMSAGGLIAKKKEDVVKSKKLKDGLSLKEMIKKKRELKGSGSSDSGFSVEILVPKAKKEDEERGSVVEEVVDHLVISNGEEIDEGNKDTENENKNVKKEQQEVLGHLIESIRNEIENHLGTHLFLKVYPLLKDMGENETSQKKLNAICSTNPRVNNVVLMKIHRLICLEDSYYGKPINS